MIDNNDTKVNEPEISDNKDKAEDRVEDKSEDKAEDKTGETAEEIAEEDDTTGENGKKKKKSKNKDRKKDKNKDKKSEKDVKRPEDINIVKDLLWLIVYIGIVILICFAIIKFVGCRSRVDGSSMNPTLYDGDNLWVDKLSYTFGDPKRFDVIIFNPGGNEKVTYVKRIIGLPGETVSMDIEGKIYINGQLLNENYAFDEPFIPMGLGILSGDSEIVLGEDEYFVLGDNRNNSMDSRRSDPGNVKREYIVGKVVLRIYPFSRFGFVE